MVKKKATWRDSQYNIDDEHILFFLFQTTGFCRIMYTIQPCAKIIGMREAAYIKKFFFFNKNFFKPFLISMEDNKTKKNSGVTSLFS